MFRQNLLFPKMQQTSLPIQRKHTPWVAFLNRNICRQLPVNPRKDWLVKTGLHVSALLCSLVHFMMIYFWSKKLKIRLVLVGIKQENSPF